MNLRNEILNHLTHLGCSIAEADGIITATTQGGVKWDFTTPMEVPAELTVHQATCQCGIVATEHCPLHGREEDDSN